MPNRKRKIVKNIKDNMFYPDHGRVYPRTCVLWKAIINIKGHTFQCQIRNLSFGGLKIQLDLPFKNGVTGIVEIPKYNLQLKAKIAWQSEGFFGLKFLDDHDVIRDQFNDGAAIIGIDAAWLMASLE